MKKGGQRDGRIKKLTSGHFANVAQIQLHDTYVNNVSMLEHEDLF